MMEPISATIITALVGLYTAYTTYKLGMAQAHSKGEPAPTKTEDVQKGEQVAQVIETGIQQHGNEDEQADLASFTRRPERYAGMVQRVLTDLAQREPSFAQQLQRVAEQTNVAISQNKQTINNQASNRGAQGIFNAPVNFGRDKG